MLLMVEKGIRGKRRAIYRYAKKNIEYMKNYDKKKSYIQYLDANNLYGWVMSQKLPVSGFEWVKNISSLNKKLEKFIKLIKNYDQDNDKGYILEVDVEYPKDLHDLHRNLPYLAEKKRKLINVINLYVVCKKKKLCCSHKSFKKSIKY